MMFGERKYKLTVLILALICIFALQGCKKSKSNNKSELSKSEISSQSSFTESSDLSESALNSEENSADKDNWETINNKGEGDTSTVSKTFENSESKSDEESSDESDSKATIVSDKDVFR